MSKIIKLALLLALLLSVLLPATPAAAYSVVDTGVTSYWYGFQRHTFYEWGNHWEFYYKSGNILYRTSEDGITWGNSTVVCASPNLQSFSIDYSAPYLSYARGNGGTDDGVLFYRRGQPQSDLTITWDTAEQDRWWDSAVWIQTTSIAVDSYGYPWVSIYYDNGVTLGNLMAKGQANDGTWGASFGFDSYFSPGAEYPGHTLIGESDGGMVWLCAKNGSVLAAKEYNGTAWQDIEYNTHAVKDWYTFATARLGGVVEVAYLTNTGWNMASEWFYSDGTGGFWWNYEVLNWGTLSSSSAPILMVDVAHSTTACIYGGAAAGTLYYQRFIYGGWTEPVLITIDAELVNNQIGCGADVPLLQWGVYYRSSDNEIRFEYLYIQTGCPIPAVDEAINITDTTAVLKAHVVTTGNSTCTGNITLTGGNATYVWDVSGNLTDDADLTIYATGLIPDTMYIYWLSMLGSGNCTALQWSGASHFNTLVCTVPAAPVVLTRPADNIGSTSARINGHLIYDGCLPCIGGFFWRKQGDPTWLESWSKAKTGVFRIYRSYHASGDTGFDNWVTGQLSGLLPSTTYEFKFEAQNAVGTTVGLVYEFTTSLPGVTPTTTSAPGDTPLGPYFPLSLSGNVKIIIALAVTLGLMFLLGTRSPEQSAGIIVAATGVVCVIGFTIFGWYPSYVIMLIGGIIGLLILLSLGKKGG